MRKLFAVVVAALLLVPGLASAQQPGKYAYTELKPVQPTESGNKIEVLEFFWYGCPHCYSLEPLIEGWTKKLPADVQFRRVPAILSERWEYDAAIYYTLDAMNLLGKLHRPFFDAIHRNGLRTENQQALAEWLGKQGVDTNRFFDTMKSMGVDAKVRRAAQLTLAYRINGTPAMAVQGRYTVSAEQGRSQQGMMEAVDYLVDIARKQK
ncbi:MAG TPA: thiol:disulfide interchange protein DsbA/DsbL [Burkholderiales bacterium]|nr:thiol:disulfide interchange protein DsbA/DsbL [Burkholderiales bacterium]